MRGDVLITGATGTLGHRVVGEATEAGHKVRALSRKPRVGYTGVHWAQGDLLSGDGIDAALDGVDIVIHCATQGTRDKDVVSAGNLIAAARRAGAPNIIYVSIVGIDRIPLPYYKTKLRVEEALTASGLGHTIIRVTQFHDLIETIFSIQRFSPALIAMRGCALPAHRHPRRRGATRRPSSTRPAGRVDDIGGPAVVQPRRAGPHVPHFPRRPSTRAVAASARCASSQP